MSRPYTATIERFAIHERPQTSIIAREVMAYTAEDCLTQVCVMFGLSLNERKGETMGVIYELTKIEPAQGDKNA
jgi:hypothetical protein